MKNAAAAILVAMLIALALAAPGCRDEQKHRASVEFYAKGARSCLAYLRRMLGDKAIGTAGKDEPELQGVNPSAYGKLYAIDKFDRAITGLPARVDKQQPPRQAERKAAATKAVELWKRIKPKLAGMPLEQATAKLDEIEALLDEVERD